jgi:hypothetical protein
LLQLKRRASLYAIKPPCIRAYSASLLALCAATALAQTVTPAQSASEEYLRQQERARLLREQQERIPDVHVPSPAVTPSLERLPANEAPCMKVNQITLAGDAADQFQWALSAANQTADGTVDSPIGRCLGTGGVNLVMRRIQNAIIARGYIAARVLSGPQEKLAQSIVQLTLFPGRIRSIRFAPDTHLRATQWNAVPAKSGDLLNLRDVEQALENFKRVPTAEADIQITPAEGADIEPGQAALLDEAKKWAPNGTNSIAMNVVIGALGGNLNSAVVKETLSWSANEMRQTMIEDSKRFKGLRDSQGNLINNMSGQSNGVNGDNFKLAGGRLVLADWCAEGRCTKAPDDARTKSGYLENPDGTVILNPVDKNGNPVTRDLIIEQHPDWRSPLGGHQGGQGQMSLFGFQFNYPKGSFWDNLAEAYAGTHDTFNGPIWYDRLGNGKI